MLYFICNIYIYFKLVFSWVLKWVTQKEKPTFFLSGSHRNTCKDSRGIKMKTYGNETHERFGNTDAYREHEKKTKNTAKKNGQR